MKNKKAFIDFRRSRRQEQNSDAIISPPNKFSDFLDLGLTPSRAIHLLAVTKLTLEALLLTPSGFHWAVMDFTSDAVRIFFLTPSGTVLSMEN
jgi:hypothetical protein